MELKDSGARREFSTGAVRDIADGKGRCDLLPISVVIPLMSKQEEANVLYHIHEFMEHGNKIDLYQAIYLFSDLRKWSIIDTILEVSKQYEDGAVKYGEHNWEKGIPLHCYIDSAIRHFLKFCGDHQDEPHDRAFVWNLLGAVWTLENKADMIDIHFPNPQPVEFVDSDDSGEVADDSQAEDITDEEMKSLMMLCKNDPAKLKAALNNM